MHITETILSPSHHPLPFVSKWSSEGEYTQAVFATPRDDEESCAWGRNRPTTPKPTPTMVGAVVGHTPPLGANAPSRGHVGFITVVRVLVVILGRRRRRFHRDDDEPDRDLGDLL